MVKKAVVKKPVGLNGSIQADIKSLLRLSTYEPEQRFWLDTGHPELNATLGSRVKGISYGKLIELRGPNHGGKTALSLFLASLAQKEQAAVGLLDIEQSRDREWSEKFGLDWDNMVKIYPKLISRGTKKPPRLESAEELFAETETAMGAISRKGYKKQFWLIDSIAMLRTKIALVGSKKQEKKGGVVDRNMRANLDRAMFLSDKLPEWCGLAASYNATIILVNQMRKNPGVIYGDNRYSPGGLGMEHAASVRCNVGRFKKGQLKRGQAVVGLMMKIENFKNKSGGKSVECENCVLKLRWDKTPARVTILTVTDAEEEYS